MRDHDTLNSIFLVKASQVLQLCNEAVEGEKPHDRADDLVQHFLLYLYI